MKQPRPIGTPETAANTFRDGEVRVLQWLCQDALRRNSVVARSADFASLMRKAQSMRGSIDRRRAEEIAFLNPPPEVVPAEPRSIAVEAGDYDGPNLSRIAEPAELPPGDPEQGRRRAGRPRGRVSDTEDVQAPSD